MSVNPWCNVLESGASECEFVRHAQVPWMAWPCSRKKASELSVI
jgi:hypothetical protein